MANLISVKSHDQAKAVLARDRFLHNHPELLPLQRKIDERLSKAKSEHNRLVVIHNLMMDSFMEMHEKLKGLMAARH